MLKDKIDLINAIVNIKESCCVKKRNLQIKFHFNYEFVKMD